MKQSHITLGSGYLFVEKRQEKLKAQFRDASYKLKKKLVVILKYIRDFTGTVL